MIKRILLITILSLSSTSLFAQALPWQIQLPNSEAEALLEAYFAPAGYAIGSAINNGWFHTAKPHKLGGFDISLSVNTIIVPNIGKSFDINTLQNFGSSSTEASTFLGNSIATPAYYNTIDVNGNLIAMNFDMPPGNKQNFIPMPLLQVGVGLIKGTEIDLRYVPPQKMYGAAKIGLYGFGMKHDILQWLPMVDKIPIDFSVQAGYTNLDAAVVVENEGINMNIQSTTINFIMSKEILMITPYLGMGYNSSSTTIDLENDQEYIIGNTLVINSNEIFPLKFDSKTEFRTTLGFRWDITILAIQANYTFAEYPVATVGIGVTVR
ncbi:MAG: DUF6588 family protein [Bacteroidota bacterium]|nr:DUF6588 family protein [Bacteroidota bacterium]